MNNCLNLKDETIKTKKAANFFILSLYSKEILKYDELRMNDFKNFYRHNKITNDSAVQFNNKNSLGKNKKYILSFATSAFLTYYFKSILVVPIFFATYISIKNLRFYFFNKITKDCGFPMSCYFCQRKLYKDEQNDKYSKYYILIKHILERNSKITNLNDFEKELDAVMKANGLLIKNT